MKKNIEKMKRIEIEGKSEGHYTIKQTSLLGAKLQMKK